MTDRRSREVAGALRSAIDAHGPITKEHVGSAAKRIIGALFPSDPFEGEVAIYRNGEWLMGIHEPFIEPVLTAIRGALPPKFFDPDED